MNYMRSAIYCTLLTLLGGLNAYKGAGILPYAQGPDGQTYFLLGLSSVHHNHASDFGGLRDAVDGFDPRVTAAREASEELMFLLDSDQQFEQLIQDRELFGSESSVAHSATYSSFYHLLCAHGPCPSVEYHGYTMYILPIDYRADLPDLLERRKALYGHRVTSCWNETTRLVWVNAQSLISAVSGSVDHALPVVFGSITLYRYFAASLHRADRWHLLPAFPLASSIA